MEMGLTKNVKPEKEFGYILKETTYRILTRRPPLMDLLALLKKAPRKEGELPEGTVDPELARVERNWEVFEATCFEATGWHARRSTSEPNN